MTLLSDSKSYLIAALALKYFLKMTFSIITQYLLKMDCKIGLSARVSMCVMALFMSVLSSVTASAQNSLTAMRIGNVDIDGDGVAFGC